jgi:signal transduction histidine kinase
VAVDNHPQSFSQTIDTHTESINSVIVVESGGQRIESSTSILGGSVEEELLREGDIPLSLLDTPLTYGPGFTAEPDIRSTASYQSPILNSEAGLVGYVELSQGPAFGRSILQDVAAGLILAGILATLLATAAGWWMSARLSRPIQTLAQTTEQMAAGDLSVRANINRQDELGQLADSFNGMANQIESTVGALRQFVADAAHELNTPLTALRTNLELAARQTPSNEHLHNAQLQAQRLERLNDDLLRLSRLESGLSEIDLESVDVSRLLNECAERFAAQAEQAELDFQLTQPDKPVLVLGNNEQLRRVLDNLFDNALKFTPPPGQVKLSLTANEDWAALVIEDSGLGISETDMPFIFHRFHRGQKTADLPGSGLGLAMVKTIIDNHQGYVTVSSQPDQGTKISVRLPIVS